MRKNFLGSLSLAVAFLVVPLAPLIAGQASAQGKVSAHGKDLSATDALRKHFELILATLQSDRFTDYSAEKRQAELRKLGARLFDWNEMSQRALGVHWSDRAPRERRVFSDHFVRLVERSYMGRVEEIDVRRVSEVPVRYVGEIPVGRETLVQTRLTHRRDLPVDFRMVHRGGKWLVVDVVVDGVSAVENYRAQFNRVMARGGYVQLLDRISAKNEGRAEDGGGSSP
jgi:phospholipid transport system substrate-binding protein